MAWVQCELLCSQSAQRISGLSRKVRPFSCWRHVFVYACSARLKPSTSAVVLIDYEPSLFPLRDSREKQTSERAWRSPAGSAAHYSRGSTRVSRFNAAGDFALSRLFVFLDNLWAERETARSLWYRGNTLLLAFSWAYQRSAFDSKSVSRRSSYLQRPWRMAQLIQIQSVELNWLKHRT